MASIIVEFNAESGVNPRLYVCAFGTYTPANGAGDIAAETDRRGVYTATIGEDLSGWHTAHILVGADETPIGDVYLVDGSRCRVRPGGPHVMTPARIPPAGPLDQEWADVYADVYDEDGELEPEVVCSLRIYKEPEGSGMIFDGVIAEATSDAGGRVCWPKRPVGAQIEYWRGPADQDSRRVKRMTITADDVVDGIYWLPKIVGHVTTDK